VPDVAPTPEPQSVDWDAVLERIENGDVPSEFCSRHRIGMPASAGEIERKAKTDSSFATRLANAKRIGATVMVAECIKIADCTQTRPDHKKIKIDARMKLAALWNPAECNPKTIVEQTTTVKSVTPRDEYIEQAMLFLGMSRGQAEAEYQRQTGETVQ
jgi:hypothetical protein